jgi:AcrR family transcriptional regulator
VRSDAARNAGAILRAAREVAAERGLAASMAEIAERAGVAVGTLYRHYPTKQDLISAVAADSVRRIIVEAEAALLRTREGSPPGEELAGLTRTIVRAHVDDRVFKQAVGGAQSYTEEPPADSDAARAWRAVASLLVLAQGAGEIRGDIGVSDLAVLLAGAPEDASRLPAYLRVVLAGLRPEGAAGS